MAVHKFLILLLAVLSSVNSVEFFYYNLPQTQTENAQGVKVIVHGIEADSTVSWYNPMIEAYTAKGFSVIAVDWSDKSNDGYVDAIEAATQVGKTIADELIQRKSSFNFGYENVHIIGHSLGAHVAGHAGKFVTQTAGAKLGRITGLDPAGPGFYAILSSKRLNSNDAIFVDVIHTNGDLLGLDLSIGHADFYPDGGGRQSSCSLLELGCSHNLAPVYMINSINKDYVAKRCSSYLSFLLGLCKSKPSALMGERCSTGAYGDYYVNM